MNSDIRLDPDRVVIQAFDLDLRHPARTVEGGSPYRRALVHDFGDRLTINYAVDYKAGTKVDGRFVVRDAVVLTAMVPNSGDPATPPSPVVQEVDVVQEIASLRNQIANLWNLTFFMADQIDKAQVAGLPCLNVAHMILKSGTYPSEYVNGVYKGPFKS